MRESFCRLMLITAVVVPLLTACGSSSEIRRPVNNLGDGLEPQGQSSQSAWRSDSGVQIYGTIDTGYGYSRTKTTVTRPDGSRSTIRASQSGLHTMGR